MSDSPIRDANTHILVLPAEHGDAIIVRTFDAAGQPFNMVIDGGTAKTFDNSLKKELVGLPLINIMVLTHIDSDHIGGLIKYIKSFQFDSDKVKRYWFNSKNIRFISIGNNIGYDQANTFEELLINSGEIKEKWAEDIFFGKNPQISDGINIEILSPTKEVVDKLYQKWPDLIEEYRIKLEDISISKHILSQVDRGTLEELAIASDAPSKTVMGDIFNSSSIAFVLRTFDLSIFFLGDSHPYLLKETMGKSGYSPKKKLKVDLVKVSHHGSKNNTINDILDMIDCDRFIISTNGGSSTHKHPDRETIARIVHHPERKKSEYKNLRKIYLNYPKPLVESKAGEFVIDKDFLTGNWQLIDNQNSFQYE